MQHKLAKSAAHKTKARYLNVEIHYSLAKSAAQKANSTKSRYLNIERTRLYTGLALCIVECGILAQG